MSPSPHTGDAVPLGQVLLRAATAAPAAFAACVAVALVVLVCGPFRGAQRPRAQ